MNRNYYNPGKLLRQMFPEQTKSNLHIMIWTVVFLLDLVGVYYLLDLCGIRFIGGSSTLRRYYLYFLIGGGLLVFWIETVIYNRLHSLFR